MSDRLANVVIGVVLTVWVVNVGADILSVNGYESNESINTAFTLTIGVAFAGRAWARDRAKKDERHEDAEP